MQIFVHHEGEESGPFSLEEVQSNLNAGTLEPTDLGWHEGMADWSPLSTLSGIQTNSLKFSTRQEPRFPQSFNPAVSQTPKQTQNKVLLILGISLSGLFALACLVAMPFILSDSKQGNGFWIKLATLVLFTIVGICIATQFLLALRQGPTTGTCALCRAKKPTIPVALNRHIGAIILLFHKAARGEFCKQCISKVFWEFTIITFLLGWWGCLSVFITPVVLINNVIVYARSFFLPNRN